MKANENNEWGPIQWQILGKICKQLGTTPEQKKEARLRMKDDEFLPTWGKYGLAHYYVKQVLKIDAQYAAGEDIVQSEDGQAIGEVLANSDGTKQAAVSRVVVDEEEW